MNTYHYAPPVWEAIVIATIIAVVFAVDMVRRWWRDNEWKRRR